MHLSKIYIASSTVLFCFFISCGGSVRSGKSAASFPGTWQATPITIDGNSKDWPSPYPNYDAKAMVAYATSNDANNLYVSLEAGEERTLMKILKQGLTISIDTGGKKSAQFHINYPLQNDNEIFDIENVHESRSHIALKQSEMRINRLIQTASQFSLEGFEGCNGGYMISQVVPCGIKVKARMDEYKQFIWEAAIPFRAIYGRDSITAADAGKPISVCYIVKGFKTATKTSGGGGGDNNSMGNLAGTAGNNSRMRNNPGTGASSGTLDPNQHYYQTTKTWKQFGLAYPK